MNDKDTKCPKCHHFISTHTFSEEYQGCDDCKCDLHLGHHIADLEALLQEAGEALESVTSIGRKDHSNEKYDGTYDRAAEIRKRIQEALQPK